MVILDYFTDFCFTIDIILTFRTTYIDAKTGEEVIEPRKIAFNYLFKGKFAIDFLSTVPFDTISDMLNAEQSFL